MCHYFRAPKGFPKVVFQKPSDPLPTLGLEGPQPTTYLHGNKAVGCHGCHDQCLLGEVLFFLSAEVPVESAGRFEGNMVETGCAQRILNSCCMISRNHRNWGYTDYDFTGSEDVGFQHYLGCTRTACARTPKKDMCWYAKCWIFLHNIKQSRWSHPNKLSKDKVFCIPLCQLVDSFIWE